MTPTILFGWEIGSGFGHIGPFIPLGRRLRAGGARLEHAVSTPATAARLLGPEGLTWMQAPVFQGPAPPTKGPPLSYADILLRVGYHDRYELLGLVGGWRRLIQLSNATLVIADHAPTAILAARTLGAPVMLQGTGFCAPPDVSPAPAMRPWESTPDETLRALEARALGTINSVLDALGAELLTRVGQLFNVAEPGVNTFAELDPYAPRPNGRYWGLLPGFDATPLAWPEGRGPRIFGYLRAEFPGTEAALAALRATRCRALVCCPNAPADWTRRFAAPHLSLIRTPVDLDQAGREADAAILYSPHTTTAVLLRYGVPMVLLPANLEQGLVAYRIEAMGAGVMVGKPGRFTDPAAALATLLGSGDIRARAMAFGRKYAAVTPASVVEAMAVRALELASGEEASAAP